MEISMKKLIFITIFILGCNSKKEFLNTNLKNISIYEYIHTKDASRTIVNISKNKVYTMYNADSIDFILHALNKKHQEFAIFMPAYEIELNYADTVKHVEVNGNYLKINGCTYETDKDLFEYLASLKKY